MVGIVAWLVLLIGLLWRYSCHVKEVLMLIFMLQLCFVTLSPEASTIEKKSGIAGKELAEAKESGAGVRSL